MFENIKLAEKVNRKLKVLDKERTTGEQAGASSCQNSCVCCWRRPGNLHEKDIKPIADFLKITPQKLFQEYLAVDDMGKGEILIPIRHDQKDIAGKFIPWRRTYDINKPCIFLDDDNRRCTIHEVKPQTCKKWKCWDVKSFKEPTSDIKPETLKELGWDGERNWDEED